jgi:hypothetical protein
LFLQVVLQVLDLVPSLLVMILVVVVLSIHDDEYDFRIGCLFMMFEFAASVARADARQAGVHSSSSLHHSYVHP